MFIPHYCIKLGERNAEEEIQNIMKYGGIEQFLKIKKMDKNQVLNKYDNQGGLICNIEILKKEQEKEKQKLKEQKEADQQKYIHHSVIIKNKNDNNINNKDIKSQSYNIQQNPLDNINNIYANQNQDNTQYYQLDTTKNMLNNSNIQFQLFDNTIIQQPNNINQNQITNNNYPYQNYGQLIPQNNSFQGQSFNENYNINNFQSPYNFQNANLSNNNYQQENNYNNNNFPNQQQQMNPLNQNIVNNNPQVQESINSDIYQNINQQTNKNSFYNDITSLKQLNYFPGIGLVNLGQTCYMNSVLQCFSNLYHITNFFLNPKKQEKIRESEKALGKNEDSLLCFAYKDLIDNLWKGTPCQPFSPIKFKKRLEKLNTLFAENTAGDSKDFANYLIMQLHSELNNIESNPYIEPNFQNIEDIKVNPYDPDQVFNVFKTNFLLNNYSIISNYFYGITQGRFECQGCKMKLFQKGIHRFPIKYNYENFFYLEFPLDEVRKYVAKQNNLLDYQTINKVNLIDCFYYNQKINTMEGYCQKCKIENAQINTQNVIFSPPLILMLIFNRGKGIQYKIKINFPPQLDLSNIVINNPNSYYELQGVVKHFGDSSSYGHFLAYCRSAVPTYQNNWHCFNDQTVVETKDWNDIVEKGDTYILFYEIKKMGQ